MSRIGQKPIIIPDQVSVKITNQTVNISGSNGTLELKIDPQIKVELKENQILVSTQGLSKKVRSLHGLTRSILANMVIGVTEGWSKTLKLVGTGYRAQLEGENLVLNLGFSHPIKVKPVAGIKFNVDGNDTIIISGADKILVGQAAAKVRKIRPPEPYKGKGIKYETEVIRRKPGKAAKVGTGFAPAGS